MSNIDNVVGIVGATIGIGQYIVNDYVITIAETEGDYGYTMTITKGTQTQTVTLYGLTPAQYDAMLGYLEAAQTAAQNAATSSGTASDAATRAETAAGQITGMTAEAVTLAPGSAATATFLDGLLTLGIPAGETGATGAQGAPGPAGETGNGIVSIIKTGTQGNVDTYTITMTDGSTSTFTVTNGENGAVLSVAGKTGAVTLDAGDVEYDDTDTYAAGSVGAGLTDLKSQMDDLQTDVDALVKNAIDSPDVLQKIVAAGHISNYLDIGDVITIPWTDNGGNAPVTYQYPFVVVNIADVYDSNNIKHENALWLMAMYATPRDIIFDAAESTPVDLVAEPNALEGWYYWGMDGTTYTALNLSTGDAIPTTHASVVKCGINNVGVLRYGYNRWKDSAYRQWLNSNAAKNEGWWTEQHMGDHPPAAAQLNLPGWLNGFTEEWRAIFKPVKVDTACNTVTDGGVTDTTHDTFFLPSVEQMYGEPQAPGVEGEYWPYWKDETGLDTPFNGSNINTNDARKIPSIANPTGNAVSCYLRSVSRGSSSYVWFMSSAGFLNTYHAYTSYRALPACVIY